MVTVRKASYTIILNFSYKLPNNEPYSRQADKSMPNGNFPRPMKYISYIFPRAAKSSPFFPSPWKQAQLISCVFLRCRFQFSNYKVAYVAISQHTYMYHCQGSSMIKDLGTKCRPERKGLCRTLKLTISCKGQSRPQNYTRIIKVSSFLCFPEKGLVLQAAVDARWRLKTKDKWRVVRLWSNATPPHGVGRIETSPSTMGSRFSLAAKF